MKNWRYYAIAGLILAAAIIALGFIYARRPRKLRTEYFDRQWHEAQKYLANKKTWSEAVIRADKLLDEALRKRRFKGKNMGERLVAAQHSLSDNDQIWFSHKLCNKLKSEEKVKVAKHDVKQALIGYIRALKDLGALK